MKIKNIRLTNLRLLIKEFGSITAVAVAASTNEKYLSQILNEYPLPSGKPRGIGDCLAEKLESGCGKPSGWIDTNHGPATAQPGEPELTPAERELLMLFRRSDDQLRAAILTTARLARR